MALSKKEYGKMFYCKLTKQNITNVSFRGGLVTKPTAIMTIRGPSTIRDLMCMIRPLHCCCTQHET